MLHRTCPYLPILALDGLPDLFERVPNRSSMPERIGGVLPGYQHSISITEVGVCVNLRNVGWRVPEFVNGNLGQGVLVLVQPLLQSCVGGIREPQDLAPGAVVNC